MKTYEGYLIDLDGAMYRGDSEVKGAAEFIHRLQEHAIPYLFVTNNASLTPDEIVEKLHGFQIPARKKDVFTSALATASYIKRKEEAAKCFVIGENGLQEAIKDANLPIVQEDADYVVIGLDREMTYQQMAEAGLQIQSGAELISTNQDKAIPKTRGLYPGNGALTAILTTTTGVEATFVGKPNKIIMNEAIKRLGVEKDKVMMIGDNYETDIQAGMQADLDTLMVLTGVTKYEDIETFSEKPTYYVNDLTEWLQHLT